jgi:hypothetical protein
MVTRNADVAIVAFFPSFPVVRARIAAGPLCRYVYLPLAVGGEPGGRHQARTSSWSRSMPS